MRLVVIVGFLGSGKTTALRSLAHELTDKGIKVAIVVNEIGEIGIDDAVLKQLDNAVWELVGGCICCTLAGDLANTLDTIQTTYKPDVVFLEPSGASVPEAMFEAIKRYCKLDPKAVHALAIVDPLRLEELNAVLGPLMESHLNCAELVLISKADLATAEQIGEARSWVQGISPSARCLVSNLKQGPDDPAMKEVMLWL